MIKNKKKAMILYPAIIGIVVGLAIYYIIILSSKPAIAGLVIGTKSITLLQASHKAEKIIFYITESAELASKQTIYDLAENKISNCGEFDGYSLLNNKEKSIDECFTNIEDNFRALFNSKLNDYLNIYPDYKIPLNNYELDVSKDEDKMEVIGYAAEEITLDVVKNQGRTVIEQTEETTKDVSAVSSDKEKVDKTKKKIEGYDSFIEKYSKTNNIDPDIIRAVITQESVGDKDAKSASALGLMQIIPKWHSKTCKKYCNIDDEGDYFDAEKNICCGAKILKDYYKERKKMEWDCCDKNTCVRTEYSDWALALRKYNSEKCIEGADADYVETVLTYYELWSGKKFPLSKESIISLTTNKILEYSIKPNFKTELDFDLAVFDKIKEQAEKLIEKCSKGGNLESCIDGNIIIFNKEDNTEWSKVEGSDRMFKFDVNTHKKLFPFEEEIIVKFALYFPEPT